MPRSHLFGPEHEEFRGTVRRFIDKEIRPNVDQWEQAQQFPRDLFRRFGALDLLGLKYEEKYGGTNAGVIYEAVLFEELGRCGSGGVAAGIGAHVAIATPPINDFARYLMVLSRNAIPWSLLGFPAVSTPCARSLSSLPIGVQFVGPPGHDGPVIALGASFERERGTW